MKHFAVAYKRPFGNTNSTLGIVSFIACGDDTSISARVDKRLHQMIKLTPPGVIFIKVKVVVYKAGVLMRTTNIRFCLKQVVSYAVQFHHEYSSLLNSFNQQTLWNIIVTFSLCCRCFVMEHVMQNCRCVSNVPLTVFRVYISIFRKTKPTYDASFYERSGNFRSTFTEQISRFGQKWTE